MFRSLFKKVDVLFSHGPELSPEEKFFSNVVGYTDIKRLLLKAVVGKEPVHILLTGPPASSKTIFLLELLDGLDDTYFVDGVGVSGQGMVEHLFNSNTKFLLIDEIDKMRRSDQATLFNVMETGILSQTKLKGKTRNKKMKVWIFATSNNVERLSAPLRSRFMELHLEEYTFEEFSEIARRVLKNKFQLDINLSEKIASAVWQRIMSKDIRDAINIAKLVKSDEDINWLVEVQLKYGRKRTIADH